MCPVDSFEMSLLFTSVAKICIKIRVISQTKGHQGVPSIKQVLLPIENHLRRGELCVKSNMVYNLCKDMVYTFELQFSCVWNPNGA